MTVELKSLLRQLRRNRSLHGGVGSCVSPYTDLVLNPGDLRGEVEDPEVSHTPLDPVYGVRGTDYGHDDTELGGSVSDTSSYYRSSTWVGLRWSGHCTVCTGRTYSGHRIC